MPALYTDIAILTSTALLTEACLQLRTDGMIGDESLVACCMNPSYLLQAAASTRAYRRLIEATSAGGDSNKTSQTSHCKYVYSNCVAFVRL